MLQCEGPLIQGENMKMLYVKGETLCITFVKSSRSVDSYISRSKLIISKDIVISRGQPE